MPRREDGGRRAVAAGRRADRRRDLLELQVKFGEMKEEIAPPRKLDSRHVRYWNKEQAARDCAVFRAYHLYELPNESYMIERLK
jgi:hypothetical protein